MQNYTVASGDTLAKIAARFGTTVAAIMSSNAGRIADPNRIFVGQVIQVPRAGTTALVPVSASPQAYGPPAPAGSGEVVQAGMFGGLSNLFQDKKKLMMLIAAVGIGYYVLVVMKKKRRAA